MSQADDLFVELRQLTGLSREEWEGVLALPEDLQKATIDNYRAQDWTKPGTNEWSRVIDVLTTLGTIAGVVGGVTGAAGAIKALTSS